MSKKSMPVRRVGRSRSSDARSVSVAAKYTGNVAIRREVGRQENHVLPGRSKMERSTSAAALHGRRPAAGRVRNKATNAAKRAQAMGARVATHKAGAEHHSAKGTRNKPTKSKGVRKTWMDQAGRQRGGATFTCVECGGLTRVLRTKRKIDMIERQRKCQSCERIFWTEEAETE